MNSLQQLNLKINLKNVMIVHAIFCLIYGSIVLVLPHGFYKINGSYNFLVHESSRLYGCLTLCLGWLVWSSRSINDGRLTKAITEAFSLAFLLQGLVMLRALFANASDPNFKFATHFLMALIFTIIGLLYGYVRLTSKLKDFELPGTFEH